MDKYLQQRFGRPQKTNVYILQLEHGKYYVGSSCDVNQRYKQHLEGKGSGWTRLFKPILTLKTISNCSVFDEDKYTKETMAKYGINNVRGGSYTNVVLTPFEMSFIQKEIWTAENKCCRCGSTTHWINECKERIDVNGKWIL